MTLKEKLKAVINNFACEQDWNIHEYAIRKRDIDYRRGKADAYRDVVHRLDEVLDEFPDEPVGNPYKMTLKELAHEMRKVIKFKYLTVESAGNDSAVYFWYEKPIFISWNQGWLGGYYGLIYSKCFNVNLDLSEYKDVLGEIDYSRCIVEVEE